MNTKALKTLEYDKIINMLITHASSDAGKQLCEQLLPSDDISVCNQALAETADACERLRRSGNISFSNSASLASSIKRADMAGQLSCSELLSIGTFLRNVSRVKKYGEGKGEASTFKLKEAITDSLSGYFDELVGAPDVASEIFRCIESEDSVSDNASAELSSIRRSLHRIEEKTHSELNSIMNSYRNYLMDPVVTMRDGCYCLPVRAEYKSKVDGVVHDISSSGSTLFIEPISVIRINNEVKALRIKEKEAIDRVLRQLTELIVPYGISIKSDIQIMAHLDLVFAKGYLAQEMEANAPDLNAVGIIDLKQARHPLIARQTIVPINISLGEGYSQLVITGPNTGGKTVCLKTIGLLTLMAQAGLFVPAFEGSRLAVFDDVYADIGDEQSIEQSLSTFSGHMKNTVEILSHVDARSLCLFDELGAGTDPTEGAALAISILSYLRRMQTRTVATTHYSELKLYALDTPDVMNASCEFDIETLRPTYRILIGVPGKSNAFAISQKLGLSEDIIEDARARIQKNDADLEDVLMRLETDRIAMEEERRKAENYRRELGELKARFEKKDEHLEARSDKILNEARVEAARLLEEAKETADKTIRNINKIVADSDILGQLENERSTIREHIKKVQSTPSRPKKATTATPAIAVHPGDKVYVRSMGVEGIVSSEPDKKGQLFVQMGIIRSQVHLSDITLVHEETISGPTKLTTSTRSDSSMKSAYISPEIKLIGMTVDEAISELDKYLDDARLASLKSVRIIHGRGTGALKKGIWSYLKKQKYIKAYRSAEFNEGGIAVTIAEFE